MRILCGICAGLLLTVFAAVPVRPGQATSEQKPDQKNVVENGGRKEIANSIGMKLVYIKPGRFMMGTPHAEIIRLKKECKEDATWFDYEGPQHEVEISKGFYLGKFEVTQGEYQAVMGKNPSYFSAAGKGKGFVQGKDTSRYPVENVSWNDAKAFCRKLTEDERKAGKLRQNEEYRLPREAEWEYACRAGAKKHQHFHSGDSFTSLQANFHGGYPFGGGAQGPCLARTTAVGEYKENCFGLHDMHGNVAEWCEDRFNQKEYQRGACKDPTGPVQGSSRVIRGGRVLDLANRCRSASRDRLDPEDRDDDLGFRVLRSSVE